MITTSLGHTMAVDTVVFPLLSFNQKDETFTCLGTGFFISPEGGFVTAKHLLLDKNGNLAAKILLGVQSTSTEERIVRVVSSLSPHPNADIAVGKLGGLASGQIGNIPLAPSLMVSTKLLDVGTEVKTFGFPRTTTEHISETKIEFTFKGKWSTGKVIEYHPDRLRMLRNSCYETTIHIEDGASGGPVFKGNYVVGVNSIGMSVPEGDEPRSGITPITFIENLNVPTDEGRLTIGELIKRDVIITEI